MSLLLKGTQHAMAPGMQSARRAIERSYDLPPHRCRYSCPIRRVRQGAGLQSDWNPSGEPGLRRPARYRDRR
jgi:hypothetical protein